MEWIIHFLPVHWNLKFLNRTNPSILADIPVEFQLDATNQALPVDYGDVCINYDRAYFEEKGLPLPTDLSDLVKPEYKGLLVVENPATSSPGLAFLMATISRFTEETWLDFWNDLRANGVVVANDWETAYYTNFSGSSERDQPMVVSYGSSPVAEYVFADPPVDEPPTASLVSAGMCYRQIEFVGILKGTRQHVAGAKVCGFYAFSAIPGGYATADVCLSSESEGAVTGSLPKICPNSG